MGLTLDRLLSNIGMTVVCILIALVCLLGYLHLLKKRGEASGRYSNAQTAGKVATIDTSDENLKGLAVAIYQEYGLCPSMDNARKVATRQYMRADRIDLFQWAAIHNYMTQYMNDELDF